MTASNAPTLLDTVTVPLGDRSYDIQIGNGLIANLGTVIAPVLDQKRTVIITDENVAPLYLETAQNALEAAGIQTQAITLKAGETTKSFQSYQNLMDQLLTLGVERKDTLIALGGGVIGDLTGFAAATLRRGVNFIQVPTSLLAQVDSSVGGKTGINTPHGKNLVGAFYQPRMVVADISVLNSLPKRELQAGYAEVVKYGLIDDPDFFNWCLANGSNIFNGDHSAQAYAIATSCRSKARIVAEDEREGGKRALLNLGHTFGHALEAECAYDGTLLHGEAVAIGMVMALDLAARLGTGSDTEKDLLTTHLRDVGMKTRPTEIGRKFTSDKLLHHMEQDKKVEAGKMVFIAGGIGRAEVRKDVPVDMVRQVLDASLCS
ncbi:3-dehydroquinate synthase [Kordiimonas sediminis]|uniref:3-dehydroquinate synthase n=1 Tax=Kordiimonas sediminis TaxID=1735581 RepID=A0A919AIB7_9PROT|nr:3-dehydroquinate synthase [Kordiimonas sediminis]GHF10672.1 3-dehydroquinate synthase [Kordiimonas sediminis]